MVEVAKIQERLLEAEKALTMRKYALAEEIATELYPQIVDGSFADNTEQLRLSLCARTQRVFGVVAISRKDYDEATVRLHDAMQQSTDAADEQLIAVVKESVGLLLVYKGDTENAKVILQDVLDVASRTGAASLQASCLYHLGFLCERIPEYVKALEYYKQALTLEEEIENADRMYSLFSAISVVYFYVADYSMSLEYMLKAQAACVQSEERDLLARMDCNIGLLYHRLGNLPLAFEYYNRAVQLCSELDNKAGLSNALGCLGNAYQESGEYERAIEYFSKALAIDEEIENSSAIAGWLLNIGNTHRKVGSYDDALQYSERALAEFELLGYQQGIAFACDSLGALYSTVDYGGFDAVKSEQYFLRSIDILERSGIKQTLAESMKSLSELYALTDRKADAYDYFRKYYDLIQEIQNEESRQLVQRYHRQRQEAEQEKHLAVERERAHATTEVLHKVLPQSIAARLIGGETEIADYFTSVSILFADISGFTPLSADMPAFMVVRFLNFVFREFDRIVRKHGCEKIKTIGDGYLAIAGAPVVADDHAERIAAAALEMQQPIYLPDDVREYLPEGAKFGVRIGIHTGAVVAGLIGDERFVYDIYSDAVNVASRMESHGEADKIHVSQDFVRHLQNRFAMTKNTEHGLVFAKRGEIEIKGKGMMRTYFLEKS